jgi:hypothetical protein
MKAYVEKMNAGQEWMLAEMIAFQEMKAGHEEMKDMLEACLENTEANSEEIMSVAENHGVPNEDATVDTIGARGNGYGNQHLAVGSRR